MTDGKKIITYRVTDKDGNEIQPQHRDLFSGQSAAELLRHIEADRQRTAKLMGYASADEMEAGQRSALLRLADEYKQWSPGKELKTLAANFAEIKSSVDATLGHFTDAQEFLRQSGLSEFNEAVKLFSGKQSDRIPAEVKPAPPKVEQTASGLSVVKRSENIQTVEISIDPPQPDRAGWDAVFNWYYLSQRYMCNGLEELSRKIGYHHNTVRKQHMLYRAQYGEQPIEIGNKMLSSTAGNRRTM